MTKSVLTSEAPRQVVRLTRSIAAGKGSRRTIQSKVAKSDLGLSNGDAKRSARARVWKWRLQPATAPPRSRREVTHRGRRDFG